MLHEGSLVLQSPFGPLPLSLNPLKTVYSKEKRFAQREKYMIPSTETEIQISGPYQSSVTGSQEIVQRGC